MLKITGDFRELNQQMWAPFRQEIDPIMSEFNKYIFQKLGIESISKFHPTTIKKYKNNLLGLYKNRSHLSPMAIINVNQIIDKIDDTIKRLEKLWNKYKYYKNIKADDIKRALLINGYKLKQFKNDIISKKRAFPIFKSFMKNMFGVK